MDPPEEAARRRHLVDPGDRLRDRLVAAALDLAHAGALQRGQVEVVEVALEALGDPPLVVEHVGRDEAAGAETGAGERLGQGPACRVEPEAAVVAHAVGGGQQPGHQRRVRGQRQGRDRHGVVEARAARRQRVEARRRRRRPAERPGVDADPVGARGVERHQEHVQPLALDTRRQAAERARRPASREQRRDHQSTPAGAETGFATVVRDRGRAFATRSYATAPPAPLKGPGRGASLGPRFLRIRPWPGASALRRGMGQGRSAIGRRRPGEERA